MKRALSMSLAAFAAVSFGCTGARTPKPPTLDDYRQAAQARPNDAKAWHDLTFAELFGSGADAAGAERALAHARQLGDASPELLFAQGLLADLHGHPNAALDAYLASIERAVRAADPARESLIEVASYAVAGQGGLARGFAEKTEARLTPLLASPALSFAARAALDDVLIPLAYRRGDAQRANTLASELGCAREFRVAGPFGPRELLGFDAPPPTDLTQPLKDRYDLGPSRGVRPTREQRAQACTLHLGGGEVSDAGTTLAETSVAVPAAGDYVVRLDTPNSVELFIDGRSALRVDRRKRLGARVVFSKLTLSRGTHRVLVRVSSRHPNPVLELAFAGYRASDAGAVAFAQPMAAEKQQPMAAAQTEPGFGLYLNVALAMARGDVLRAREMLAPISDDPHAAAPFLLQRSGLALSDPLLPDGVRGDEARRYLALAASRDPALWSPVLQLASLAAKAGRVKESIAVLRKAEAHWPEVPAIGLALAQLLRSKNFHAAADRTLVRVRDIVPDACPPMAAQLDALRARSRYIEATELAKQLVKCDAQSNALYSLYVERHAFDEAQKELERLDALQPQSNRYSTLLAQLALAKNMGDDKAQAASIAELRSRFPRSYTGALEQIDALNASGKKTQAMEALQAATRAEPASMLGLYRVARVFGEPYVMQPWRKDGLAAIKAFEASGKTYDGPQVLVLDYMAVRVFSDGSSLELVHTVQKAQSDEAVDQLAEVEVPEGAQVLTLRSIKPDGRKLEADNISGKSSVSLPNFAPGDYVEFEYVQANAPSEGFPGGYLGERFYFKSFEVPFHHSQMVVILPAEMPYQIDPRGDAPHVHEEVKDGLRVLDFHVDQSLPLVEEPNSVAAREFIPSTRVGVNATFGALVDSLRDVLSDRDLYDPYYAKLVSQIVGDAAPGDVRTRAERLYSWVLENIDNNNDVFSQAALMLRAKAGNRARVLNYLLGLAHVPSQLALARSYANDSTVSTMADAESYDHLVVRVDTGGAGKEPLWLFTNERWAPFGFLPASVRGQPALLLEPGAPLVKVSQGLLGEDTRHFAIAAQLHADGSARLDVTETLHGGEAVAWRGQLEQIPQAELNHRMEQDYAARLFPGASLVSLDISGREQDKPDLVLHYVLDVSNYARPISGGLSLPPLLPSEVAANLARTATRKTTELLASPLRTEISFDLTLPAGFTPPPLPQPELLSGAFAARPQFREQDSMQSGKLHIERSLELPRMRIDPKDYPAFSEFCRRVDELEGRELAVHAAL